MGQTKFFAIISVMFILLSATGPARAATRVGIWIDGRSGNVTGLTRTLEQAGYEVTTIDRGNRDFVDPEFRDQLDVLFFPGGWNAYQFLNFESRKAAIDFVAQGKGILAGYFRGGFVRTSNRPLFPEVGMGYNRVSANYVIAGDEHPILDGIEMPWGHPNWWDHVVMRAGPDATVFLRDPAGDPVGISGEPWGGRYAAIGIYFSGREEPLEGNLERLFLNAIGWVAGAERPTGAALEAGRAAAELDFLRRERIMDYTHHERGPDTRPGVIPAAHNLIETELEMWYLRLNRARQQLKPAGLVSRLWRRRRDAALIDRSIAALEEQLGELSRNTERVVQGKLDEINAADAQTLLDDDPAAFVEGLAERLLPRANIDRVTAAAEAAYLQVADILSEDRAAAEAAERKRDAQAVPALIAQGGSNDVEERRRAVLELGRIGDSRATAVLIERISDPDEQTRRNAIHALGWLQAREAVPALLEAAQGNDAWMRRRAVQALGQIGDRAAVPTLIEAVTHPDYYTAVNAILGLGWLGDPAAVPALLELLDTLDPETTHYRWQDFDNDRIVSAITALGQIGDDRALPALEKLAAGEIRRDGRFDRTLAPPDAAQAAIDKIAAGGRDETGVRQPEYLALHRHFHGLREEFNFFVGRPLLMFNSFPQFQKFPEAFFDYIHEAGATGLINGWYETRLDAEDTARKMKWAGERDIKWILDMPLIQGYVGRVQKSGCADIILKHHDEPAFGGFWSEENYPLINPVAGAFEEFLTDKYGPDFRDELGLSEDQPIGRPANEDYARLESRATRVLWAEYLDWGGREIIEEWREAQEFMHGLRKATAFTFNVTAPSYMSDFLGIYPRAGAVTDLHGPESYASGGTDAAFLNDLLRDGETRPVLCEFYNWYSPDTAWAERGYAMHLMHGESFFNFYFGQIFKQAPHYSFWAWDPTRWDAARRVFQKARDVRGYLGRTGSAANVALIYSDRTSQLFYKRVMHDRSGRPRRYHQHQVGLWQSLQQEHVPLDSIWTETMTPEKLARYEALVLADAKSLTPDEEGMLREWVRNGGVLLTGGTTSLFDQWGNREENYRLADVFGIDYLGHREAVTAEQSDTYGFIDGSRSVEPIFGENLDPREILYFVHREVKPEVSLTTFDLLDNDFLAGELPRSEGLEYDYALGYDHIRPQGAEVIAQWENGDPAITVNRFGDGLSIFRTEIYPGLSHVASNWEMHALYKDFWPGVQELTGELLRSGMRETGAALPLELDGCPQLVGASIRTQPHEQRWMLHFMNHDNRLEHVDGFAVTVRPPVTEDVRLYYADDGSAIPYRREGDALLFDVRDFEVHEMVVVDYSEGR